MSPDYQQKLVSVIIPTYNRAQFIRFPLQSIRNQTYRPIEIIVVDDGSDDGTKRVIEEFSHSARADDLSVSYIRQKNKGAPAARNRGLIETRGEFIQYLDSDDVIHPNKIQVHVAATKLYPPCDYVWSNYNAFDIQCGIPEFACQDLSVLNKSRYVPALETFSAASNVWIGLYRRSACVKTGPWNEELRRWQDLEYQMRFTSLAPSCRFVDAVLGSMGMHAAERIRALQTRAEGIQAGLLSLRFVEKTLDALAEPLNQTARNSVATFYLALLKLALVNHRPADAMSAIEGARRNRRDRAFLVRLTLLDVVQRYCSPRLAGVAMGLYSKVALGVALSERPRSYFDFAP
jgi:glycosyltransferase involved in cell wall biosynthesis